MHGREGGENWKRSRHMWSVPTRGTKKTRTLARDSTSDSFCKDGRKISVGDCALFKPSQDSPPYIGIIRWLTSNKESSLQIGVNWLYRPPEVKLGKGILLDAAPNEVFYSFHKDEIPAASLLHPCKVTFLPKGAELPSGISSFVCRRVYDIANNCLWWLSDQDYINERQEEVDQLLYKTRIKMHATIQSGGRSPKQVNGPTSTSQLKPGADNVAGATSFASQVKGKKRERVDQASEPAKRERSLKTDDAESGHSKPDNCLKSEISKITERGGLKDTEVVEKLLQIMQPDRAERKMDLISRSIIAGVIAATDKFDCLNRFVHLKGLPILDEWLQDIQKGRIGEGSSLKDGDKSVDDFLLVLLRALDKLPVNLHALQMCNIGKSVNHLRTSKNLEIQRKARTLVDTWKKRVEAEMNIIDAKSGSSQAVSWSSRSRLTEVPQTGNRHPGVSSEVPIKNSVTQLPASKPTSVKPVQGESTVKSASSSPGPIKSTLSPVSGKDSQSKYVSGSNSDLPTTTAREEKSSSSSQSHNNSQSFSSENAKTMGFSGKEDARSSTAGSMNVNKLSGSGSRHRRSNNSFPVAAGGSGVQRDMGSNRSASLQRISASEKLSHSGLTCEKSLDAPTAEGNSHKLIVKIPNRGRSPAQSASGGSYDDPSIMNSRVSSPAVSDKHDQFDRNSKEKTDAYRANITSDVNTESWQSNDFKDVLTGSDEGDGSPGGIPDEEPTGSGDDVRKSAGVPKAASSSSGNELKTGKLHEASFSSINVLIESCVNYSEANASIRAGDDVGMNLLASVAAGEILKSGLGSPTDSPQGNTTVVDETCAERDVKTKSLNVDNGTASANYNGDKKNAVSDETAGGEHSDHLNRSSMDLRQTADPSCLGTNEKLDEVNDSVSVSVSEAHASTVDKVIDARGAKQLNERESVVTSGSIDAALDTKPIESSSQLIDDKAGSALKIVEVGTQAVEGPSLEIGCQDKKNAPPVVIMLSTRSEWTDEGILRPGIGCDLSSEGVSDSKGGKANGRGARNHINQIEEQKNDQEASGYRDVENLVKTISGSSRYKESVKPNVQHKEDPINHGREDLQKDSPASCIQKIEQHRRSNGSKLAGKDEIVESASTIADDASFPAAGASDMDEKPKFDLNEGFFLDDGKCGESLNMTTPGCLTAGHLVNSLPFLVSSVSSGFPASITVAAAAKGSFVPPEDLLRSKGELGWKGSAATSAFRPAEPRRVLDMPLGTASVPSHHGTTSKHSRPVLDFDLNVPDERLLEDMASQNSGLKKASLFGHKYSHNFPPNDMIGSASLRGSGGLDLDLNRIDETNDLVHQSSKTPLLHVKSSSIGGFPNSEMRRDFDLNDGPTLDELSAEPLSLNQHGRSGIQSQPTVSGLRMNNSEIGNLSSWFQPGNYSSLTVPSILHDRGDQSFPIVATGGPQRTMGPPIGGTMFSPDVYRGSVISSSPAVPFPSSPFQYPVFPFGNSFPFSSATFSGGTTTYMDNASGGRLCFPAVNSQLLGPAGGVNSQLLGPAGGVNSQLLGPAGAISSQYPRPYIVSLQDGGNNIGFENNRKWTRQGLDLNAGPGGLDMEGRDDTLPLTSRQLSVAGSHALAEEQARMYHMAGGASKRKEPDGGWESENFSSMRKKSNG